MTFEDLIGNTPMLRLTENLFAKLEYTNLTGSAKDRAAWQMVLDGERRGLLRPGGTIIEPTSGNMGISLAAIAARRGYGCIIVMPESMSRERQTLVRAYGAALVLTPGAQGMAGAVEQARALADQTPGAFLPGQFDNPANAVAHYRTTGPEIWRQTQGRVDVLVAGVGTGGTLTGAGRFLREKRVKLRIVAVEPAESPMLSKGISGRHGIEGIGANFIPAVLDRTLPDTIVAISEADAFAAARALARQGILAGASSGAAYSAAAAIARAEPEKRVVTIFPDAGNRYLSTGLFYDGDRETVQKRRCNDMHFHTL